MCAHLCIICIILSVSILSTFSTFSSFFLVRDTFEPFGNTVAFSPPSHLVTFDILMKGLFFHESLPYFSEWFCHWQKTACACSSAFCFDISVADIHLPFTCLQFPGQADKTWLGILKPTCSRLQLEWRVSVDKHLHELVHVYPPTVWVYIDTLF